MKMSEETTISGRKVRVFIPVGNFIKIRSMAFLLSIRKILE